MLKRISHLVVGHRTSRCLLFSIVLILSPSGTTELCSDNILSANRNHSSMCKGLREIRFPDRAYEPAYRTVDMFQTSKESWYSSALSDRHQRQKETMEIPLDGSLPRGLRSTNGEFRSLSLGHLPHSSIVDDLLSLLDDAWLAVFNQLTEYFDHFRLVTCLIRPLSTTCSFF